MYVYLYNSKVFESIYNKKLFLNTFKVISKYGGDIDGDSDNDMQQSILQYKNV